MELYIEAAIRTNNGIIKKKIGMPEIIKAFFSFVERGSIDPESSDSWAGLHIVYTEDVLSGGPEPDVSMKVCKTTPGNAVVAVAEHARSYMAINEPSINVYGEHKDRTLYPMAGVSEESCISDGGETYPRYMSKLYIGQDSRAGIMMLSDSILHDEDRTTKFSVPSADREITEAITLHPQEDNQAAASQGETDEKDVGGFPDVDAQEETEADNGGEEADESHEVSDEEATGGFSDDFFDDDEADEEDDDGDADEDGEKEYNVRISISAFVKSRGNSASDALRNLENKIGFLDEDTLNDILDVIKEHISDGDIDCEDAEEVDEG